MKNRILIVLAIVAAGCGASGTSDEPQIIREDVEWLDVWMPDFNAKGLPRVLLIGDSIVRGYGPQVEKQLKGKAIVARMATSKSVGDPALLAEVSLILGQAKFDVIHFNNGLHGSGYSEDDYRKAFPDLIAALKRGAPESKLIWAATTPVRDREHPGRLGALTDRVVARNAIVLKVVEAEKIPVDDLFALVVDHPEYYDLDGVHFNGKGVAAQANQVVARIKAALDAPR